MPIPLAFWIGGAVGAGLTWIVSGGSEKVGSIVKWAAIGGAVYVGAKVAKVI